MDLTKKSEEESSFFISAMFWEMKRAVSRLWERIPVTKSVRVFSNMAEYYYYDDDDMSCTVQYYLAEMVWL